MAAAAVTLESLVAKAADVLGADIPSADNLLRIASQLAQMVNNLPDLRGAEKAAMVQQALRDLLKVPAVREKLSEEAAAALTPVIDTVVPTVLTLIVSAGRGEFDLKKVKAEAVSAISMWCCRQAHTVIATTVPAQPSAPAPAPAPALAPAPAPADDTSSAPKESTESPAEPTSEPAP